MISSERQHQINRFIQTLDEDELHALYHQLADRMRLVRRARELYAMKDFQILDKVSFVHAGRHIEGTVMRINQRTISVLSTDGVRWNVSPQFLRKLVTTSGAGDYAEAGTAEAEANAEADGPDILLGIGAGSQPGVSPGPKSRSGTNKKKRKKKNKRP